MNGKSWPPADPLLRDTPYGPVINWSLKHAVRRHIYAALDYCEGDLGWAASELGVSPSTLWRMRRAVKPRTEVR